MRNLMSSNPFQPAKESLVALFDEIRKKVSRAKWKVEKLSLLIIHLFVLNKYKALVSFLLVFP